MLNDEHFKVLQYESDARKVFPNTDIMGGVAITYHDGNQTYEPIHVFTAFPELNSILKKVLSFGQFKTLADEIYIQNKFDLDKLYAEYPKFKSVIGSNGKDKRFRNNIFDKIDIFTDEQKNQTDIHVLGIQSNKRVWKFFPKRFIDLDHDNLDKWKVLLPRANGSGAIGKTIPTPLIGEPLVAKPFEGYTQSFIAIGSFSKKSEASAALKYTKSKFMRCMLGVLKITQDNNKDAWKMVPTQDFTSNSDINWNTSVKNIDKQLYKKYKLSKEEIAFIETHVKEMD